ncbi:MULTISPECIES: hypothetical protein [Paenibacillus]|uniref:hypothetical protein n=1 Tax=Paenibacillus TaxID=44249 RepID=UPI002040E6F6|nr:hypothetical protein [Paenibacillus camelliae]MCM3633196.1 hypothetical protein [Paenibacillus camelliae]
MNLTAAWFVINIFFVASFIVTLFMHRAVMMSATSPGDSSRNKKLKIIRNSFIVATAILFVAMSATFISNMYING